MGGPVLLVITSTGVDADWFAAARDFCTVHRVHSAEELSGRIKLHCPHALCFEFDKYDPDCLDLLQRTKQAHPSLPILMITEEHSEELAVWALRAHVWDYIVKPVLMKELYCAIMTIFQLVTSSGAPRAPQLANQSNRMLTRTILPDGRSRAEVAIGIARAYIARHLSEKISGSELANRCAMSYFHFSRTFHRVTGMTLRDYILRERINLAAQMLTNQAVRSVTTVCFSTGFSDLSYFARMFRRYKGVSPSVFRQASLAGATPAPSTDNVLYADRAAS